LYQKITADHIFTGYQMLPQGQVLVLDNRGIVEDIISVEDAGENVQYCTGVLSPGLINAHCHLELSHLFKSFEEGQGLIAFITSVMHHRRAEAEIIQLAMQKADAEMFANGIVAVGDICNSEVSVAVKQPSKIYYHSFVEVAGFSEEIATPRFDYALQVADIFAASGLSHSIVPHAPYSVSDHLMKMICNHGSQAAMTMHNQETKDENLWFFSKQGGFEKFYSALNINTQAFHAKGKSSLEHVLPFLDPAQKNILVHNVHTSAADLDAAMNRFSAFDERLYFCCCPNANQFISRQMPNLPLFLQKGVRLVLGTDSLASNHQLDLMSEMQTLQAHFPDLQLEMMLQWATINGAKALGIENKYGSFEKGKSPGVIAIANHKATLIIQPH
jgi:cytosine/adenosine deaminase-related metal-dependent hydrolase